MNKEVNWIEHRGRVFLKDVLPLNTPFKIEVEPTSACNFKYILQIFNRKNKASIYEHGNI